MQFRRLGCAPQGGVLHLEVAGKSAQFYYFTKAEGEGLNSLGGERHLLEPFLQSLRPGDCVYDVGAGIGLYTLFAAKTVGKEGFVVAVEPEEYCHERLQENLRLNGLTNVRTFRLALGDRHRVVHMVPPDRKTFSLVGVSPRKRWLAQRIEVVPGDWLIESKCLPIPTAVKIDVEGYEYAVIEGLSRTLAQKACKLASCEVHPRLLPAEVMPERVLDQLKALGFTNLKVCQHPNYLHVQAQKATNQRDHS
ncbi:MAG: FkbM family methyltransferase [Acidobacteriota bacterium]